MYKRQQHILDWISDCYLILSETGLVLNYNQPFAQIIGSRCGIEINKPLINIDVYKRQLLGLTVYLSRVHAQKAPVIGVPVINRSQSKEKNAGGMFVSTLPFRCETDPAQTADQFCQTLNDQWYRLLKHQKYPFTEIMKLARAQQPELEALFSIALSYEDTRLTPPSDTTVHFSGAWHFSGWQMEELCLHVSHRETAALQIDYDYQVQSFSEARIAQLHQSLTVILQDCLLYTSAPRRSALKNSFIVPPLRVSAPPCARIRRC